MNSGPENRIYIVIIGLGIFLVTVTTVLQAAVLRSRTEQATDRGIIAAFRQKLANAINPDNRAPGTVSQSTVVEALQVPTTTSAPVVIVVTATPAATATAAPTDTALPPPTNTPAPTPESTDTVAAEAPAAPTAVQIDIRLASTRRRVDCTNMTAIAGQILSSRFQMQVQVMFFDSPTQMFDALADGTAEVTLCYLDPDDRSMMRDRLGLIRQIGVQHHVGADHKLQMWANGAYKAQLRDTRACVLDFLEKVDFTGLETENPDPQGWLQDHSSALAGWLNCSL